MRMCLCLRLSLRLLIKYQHCTFMIRYVDYKKVFDKKYYKIMEFYVFFCYTRDFSSQTINIQIIIKSTNVHLISCMS